MKDKLPYEKGFHVSWDQIHRDSRALAWRLENKGPENGHWRGLIASTRGGMVPAMIIARELDIRLVETISIKSYDHKNQSEAKILKDPNANLISDGSGIVIIDDLVDSGDTAKIVKDMMPNSKFVVLYAKTSGKKQADLHLYDFKDKDWLVFPWEQD